MRKDLVALVADVQQEKVLETLLCERRDSLGIRLVTFDVYRHPHKDPGVYHEAANFLAPYQPPMYHHALVLLDRTWEGVPGDSAFLRQDLLGQLCSKGWNENNCQVIVIDPELEAWAWSTSQAVSEVLRTTWDEIRVVAQQHGYWTEGQPKPNRPKDLLEAILKKKYIPRSSALFQTLARRVGLARCQDPTFLLLQQTLTRWFAR